MSINRNQIHDKILTCIYIQLSYIDLGDTLDIKKSLEDIFEDEYDNIDVFARKVVIKCPIYINEIIPAFESNLTNWRWERLPLITQAILLMSYTHHRYCDEKTDKAVIIDIAVKLAKKYLDNKDYRFVNAILDKTL